MDDFFNFLNLGSASGIVLMVAALLALIAANSPAHVYYGALIDLPVSVQFGSFVIAKPLLLWINDGLMAIFFFLIGLELKREVVEGALSDIRSALMPAIGAVGGMAAPALVYVLVNQGNPETLSGWAIPAATDIAFTLGILALLGPRVPPALKVFLVSLAIFDDLGAIIVIALFYTDNLSMLALTIAGACIAGLALLNWRHVTSIVPYLLIGLVMWVAVLKSGVHATLAGVVMALFLPIKPAEGDTYSPSKELEHDLHKPVAFGILPLFAFANAGVPLLGVSLSSLIHPVPIGIALGLFLGKPLGIFGLCWISLKLGVAQLPKGVNLRALFGLSVLCGVGFTMSLFIGALAFDSTSIDRFFDERLGILMGSLISGVVGYGLLRWVLPEKREASV